MVTSTMNDLSEVERVIRAMKNNVRRAASWAEEMAAKDALAIAQELSSGTKTLSDRRKADYPFAKRHGAPKWVPWMINRGTGEFYADWHIQKGQVSGDGTLVVNYSEVASYLKDGTKYAFSRPLDEKVLERMDAKPNNYFRIALEGK